MRIVGGQWRGRKLSEPRGRDVTRPTTDRVREAMASMIESALDEGIAGARFLDAFAGSGALGIEMLSRGASFASFYDIDRAACQLVRKNLETLGTQPARYRVSCGDVVAQAGRGRVFGAPFDVVMIDAPYALGAEPAERLLASLRSSESLAVRALALVERASDGPKAAPDGFELLRSKRYGSTSVELFRFVDAGFAPSDPS